MTRLTFDIIALALILLPAAPVAVLVVGAVVVMWRRG